MLEFIGSRKNVVVITVVTTMNAVLRGMWQMKAIAKLCIIGAVAIVFVSTISGCGDSGGPDVPQTAEEKIKAIEANPDYKPEQKEAYKKQVAENERLKAMVEQRSHEMTQKNPAPR